VVGWVLVVAVVAIGVVAVAYVLLEGDGSYRMSNVELEPAFAQGDGDQREPVAWQVRFDATWTGSGLPSTQATPCTVRLLDAEGSAIYQGQFGLYIGETKHASDVSIPRPIPADEVNGTPERAAVSC
jgi:hypothetical protein